MAYINWNAGSTGQAWLQNAADAIGAVSGWTVLARGVTLDTTSWLTVVRCDAGGFVVWMNAIGTNGSSIRGGVAEAFDPATNTFTRMGWRAQAAPAAVYSDGSYTGGTAATVSAYSSDGNFTVSSALPHLTGAAILDTFIAFNVTLSAFTFDTAVADPATDTVRIGSISGSNYFSATRIPLAGSLPSPQTIGGSVNPWVSSNFTAGPDAYNVANPTAYLFTPVVFRHGTPVGQVRGTTGNLLWCAAGVTAEEVLIPGEGTYRKMATGLWAKVG